MYKSNIELRAESRARLEGLWGMTAGAMFIYFAVQLGLSFIPILGDIASFIIGGPFALGLVIFFTNISRKREATPGNIFDGFQDFGRAFITYLISGLLIILGLILLIIPGIIIAFNYSMVYYILADDKNIQPWDALKKSSEMMKGHKMRFFVLNLSFIGWVILSVFTLFIGLIWLIPYIGVTNANFYLDLKKEFDGEDSTDFTDHLVGNVLD